MPHSAPFEHNGAGPSVEMTDAQFRQLSALVHEHLGIRLGSEKRLLLEARLRKVMDGLRVRTLDELFRKHLSQGEVSAPLLAQLVDHVTTSHTHFHREPSHFAHFAQHVLPEALRRRSRDRDLRVWCAAAATGQEPYELVMVMREVLGADYASWRAGLLATDVSARALAIAREALYTADDAQRLPEARRRRHMDEEADGRWRVRDEVRREVTFRRLNLLEESYPFRRDFDVIFCRNVLMYFNDDTRASVVNRLASVLAPGGILFVGHTEALTQLGTRFVTVGPGIYRLPG
jgi:chemotaxis protein methyltransferase CheR